MKVEDIDVSLRYGKLLNKGWIIFSYIVLGLLTLLLSYCVYDTYSSTRNIIDILYIVFCINICRLYLDYIKVQNDTEKNKRMFKRCSRVDGLF